MQIKFFPKDTLFDSENTEPKDEGGDVGKELSDLSKQRNDLYLRVKSFFKQLKNVKDIASYLKIKQMEKFTGDKEGLYEMRIPKQAQGGVVRIYFCFSETEENTIILLDLELKHKKKPMRLDAAYKKMLWYKALVQQGRTL